MQTKHIMNLKDLSVNIVTPIYNPVNCILKSYHLSLQNKRSLKSCQTILFRLGGNSHSETP